MPTPFFLTGFEHGVIASTGGGLFRSVTNSPTADSTVKRSGSYSMRCYKTAAAACYVSFPTPPSSQTYIVGRFYIRLDTDPSSWSGILRWDTAGATAFYIGLSTAGVLQVQVHGSGSAVNGPTLTHGQWYRVDFRLYCGGETYTIDWQVDGTAQTQATRTGMTASTFSTTTHRLGSSSSCTIDVYFDDVILSNVSGDYPIGAGSVVGLSPSGAGTSVNPSNFEDNGGIDVNDSSNPASAELDDVPLSETGDYITQNGGSASDYVEVVFADTTKGTINGARAIVAYQSAAASPGNSAASKIYDEDGTEQTIYSGDMSESSMYYKAVMLTAPAGGWDQAAVNALKGRVGYASDYDALPRWHALMIEVDGVDSTAVTLTVQEGSQGQAADGVDLTQAQLLAAQDAAQGQAVDEPALVQAQILELADASQAQAPDVPGLVQNQVLAAVEAAQAQAAEEPVLDQSQLLAASEASQAQLADAPDITQAQVLEAQEGAQGQAADSPSLVQAHSLEVQEAAQDQSGDGVLLDVSAALEAQGVLQGQIAAAVDLIQAHLLAVDDALQSQAGEDVFLGQAIILVVDGAAQAVVVDRVELNAYSPGMVTDAVQPREAARSAEIDGQKRTASGHGARTFVVNRRRS
jgi:hypothetical protein